MSCEDECAHTGWIEELIEERDAALAEVERLRKLIYNNFHTAMNIQCELCGASLTLDRPTSYGDLIDGHVKVPAHPARGARNGAPCTYAGTVVRL